MKKIVSVALIIIISLFLLTVVKDQITKLAVTVVTSQITGTKVKIQGLSLGIIRQAVRINGLKIYNPAGFPKGVMADIRQVYVVSDLWALLRGKLHLQEVSIDLKELVLVKNKEGKAGS